jgi:hypothetical protein
MLQRPFFTPTVIALWFVTTGWLTIAKILPDWQPGSPPGQQTLYASGERLLPVAWTVFCNEQPVGWAITRTTRSADRGVFVDSHLHFDRLPWDKMLPGWATLLVQRLVPGNDPGTFDARGRLAIDEAGDLRSFSSVVHLPGTDQPLVLTGTVEDGTVAIKVTAGELGYEATRHLPTTAMLGDELSPQATLPDLHAGRRWTVPVYSPLRPGRSPIEVLHAEVGGEETMYWEDGFVQAKVVSYRDDPSSDREPRCRLWVDPAGRVLRQEAALLGAAVAFVRRSDEEAARMAAAEAAWSPGASPPSDPRPAPPAPTAGLNPPPRRMPP